MLFHFRVGEKRLRDGRGVGEAGGLDEDGVEAVLALHQPAEDADEVAADGAADAPVVHLKNFLVALDDELVVHADFAELVFDHGDFLAVLLGEDAVEEGGLAGAEKAGEDSDGNGSRSHEQGAWSWEQVSKAVNDEFATRRDRQATRTKSSIGTLALM